MIKFQSYYRVWFRRGVVIAMFLIVIVPVALYFKYLKARPLHPVTGVVHLFWSPDGEHFNQSQDRYTVSRTLSGRREKLVVRFPEAIVFKRLRVDPMEAMKGAVTFHELRIYDTEDKSLRSVTFDEQGANWICAGCQVLGSRSGWQLFTEGNLAVASPVFPDTKAVKIEIELTVIPMNETIDFMSWLEDKYLK